MRILVRSVVVALVMVVAGSWGASAADWYQWRGPEQNGISRETGLPETWSLDTGENVLWVDELGGRATPIILNGKVYLNCRTLHNTSDPQEKIHAREQVVCWDAETGKVEWRDVFNVFQTDIPSPRVGWASMSGDPETGNVYVHSVSGLFRCYSGDGKVLWEHSLFEDFGRVSGYGGRTLTPVIDEDRVILGFLTINWGENGAPPPKYCYYAFDKRSGEVLWESAVGGRAVDTIYSVPVVAVVDGVRQLIGGNSDGGVYSVNARTGEPLWGFRISHRGLNASPVVEGHLVYIAQGEDNIDNVEFGRVQCIDARGRGDVTDSHGVWRVDGIKAGYTALLVHDGILYVVSDTGILHAFDSKTGDPLWEYILGTVGKGSPVWADGKLYVMEVNGNIHVLRPSRERCESVSHVQLSAINGQGTDEIYASPAIANGRIYFVTRDRTICVGAKEPDRQSVSIPPMPEEAAAGNEVATARLVPYEVLLNAGDTVNFAMRLYDKNGRFLRQEDPQLTLGPGLEGSTVSGNSLTTATAGGDQAGIVTASLGDVSAQARIRSFPPLPWSWDFEGYTGQQTPPTWISAMLKLQPTPLEGNTVMRNAGGRGRPSTYVWMGPSTMKDYVIQSDVMLTEDRRQMPNVGITCQRYTLVLKGNTSKVQLQDWPPHPRIDKEARFRVDPRKWYTLKLQVDQDGDQAIVRGKVWPRGEAEPAAWTVEQVDPHPNTHGSPGLYTYALAESYFDNIQITEKSR